MLGSVARTSSASATRLMATLVVAEHSQGLVAKSTMSAITAAAQLGSEPVHVLVAGEGVQQAAEEARKIAGVGKVIVADSPALQGWLAEPVSALLQSLIQRSAFEACVMPASTTGKNILPRVAALLGVQPITDVVAILEPRLFKRPIYAGNAIATVQYSGAGPCLLTVRPTSFEAAPLGDTAAELQAVTPEDLASAVDAAAQAQSSWVSEEVKASGRPDLGTARVVVSGGRALKSVEGFAMLEGLADQLGAAVGASRAAVDAGYVANELQVGQTGKVVAPDLYIAVGISGAIQHMAGMKDSKVIVAINTDADAPIFKAADYGLVQDLFTAIPELSAELKRTAAV